MSTHSTASVTSRKQPRQARSEALVDAILAAAVQVLVQEGAARFTTARVAERAGVSVGSLYQYFPNKAAILFRLQTDEWRQTGSMLHTILSDRSRPPTDRLRTLVHAFVRSECEEAAVRVALDDAAPFYRNAPEAEAARAEGGRLFASFMEEALPRVDAATRAQAGELVTATLSAVGKRISETPQQPVAVERYADAMADMICAYLDSLGRRPPGRRARDRSCAEASSAPKVST